MFLTSSSELCSSWVPGSRGGSCTALLDFLMPVFARGPLTRCCDQKSFDAQFLGTRILDALSKHFPTDIWIGSWPCRAVATLNTEDISQYTRAVSSPRCFKSIKVRSSQYLTALSVKQCESSLERCEIPSIAKDTCSNLFETFVWRPLPKAQDASSGSIQSRVWLVTRGAS